MAKRTDDKLATWAEVRGTICPKDMARLKLHVGAMSANTGQPYTHQDFLRVAIRERLDRIEKKISH